MPQLTDEPTCPAFDEIKHLRTEAETRRLAFVLERARRDELTLLKEARAEGRAEGLAEARAERLAQGEQAVRRTVALDLIRQTDLDNATIGAITRLPVEEIAVLRTDADAR